MLIVGHATAFVSAHGAWSHPPFTRLARPGQCYTRRMVRRHLMSVDELALAGLCAVPDEED